MRKSFGEDSKKTYDVDAIEKNMTVFVLKLIAMTTMVVDHVGYEFCGDAFWMRAVGRLAFVTYAFLMAESYRCLKNKPDRLRFHVVKLLALFLVTEIPHDLFLSAEPFDFSSQNAIGDLALGFVALILQGWTSRKLRDRRAIAVLCSVAVFVAAVAASRLLRTEYKGGGIVLIEAFYLYLQRANSWRVPARLTALAAICALFPAALVWTYCGFLGFSETIAMARYVPRWYAGVFLTVVPLAFYNQKLGYHSRWFGWFYSVFYPLQFILLIMAESLF